MNISEQFMQLFKGSDFAHGITTVTGKTSDKGKAEVRCRTVNGPTNVELWEKHLKGEQGLGIIPIRSDSTCGWGAIDIDDYNIDLHVLEKNITKLKLPLVLCRTKSGGAHLYLFLKEAATAKEVRRILTNWIAALGFPPNTEIFPKQDLLAGHRNVGNWLNMPYFDSGQTKRYCIKDGEIINAQEFVAYATAMAVNEVDLKELFATNNIEFSDGPPCLEQLAKDGFPEGSMNNALFDCGVYAKNKFPDEWEDKIPEYNDRFFHGKQAEVHNTIKSLNKKDYFYMCNQPPINQFCDKVKCRKREFGIVQGVEDDDELNELNEKHFVVSESGKAVVYTEAFDEHEGRVKLTKSSFADFRNLYMNRCMHIGNNKFVPLGYWWLKHPKRRQYESIVFTPGKDVPGAYNLWRGLDVEPVKGDWSLMQEHMLVVLCLGNKKHFQYLLSCMARAVQFPAMQGEVCIVLKGGQGAGKGIVFDNLGKCFGQHYFHISNSRHLTGNFNAHLRVCVFLFADEAFFAGDKSHIGVLKMLITEPTLAYEAKGIDTVMGPNYIHLFMASNEDWVVPAEMDDRRFFVLEVSNKYQSDRAYFNALAQQMENGGREAMLYDLLNMDLSDFEVRNVPKTEALLEQKQLTLLPEDKWLFEKLQDGRWLRWHAGWDTGGVPANLLWDDYIKHSGQTGEYRKSVSTRLGMKLHKVFGTRLKKVTNQRYDNPTGRHDKYGDIIFSYEHGALFYFPKLEECRKLFEVYLRAEGQVKWEAVADVEVDCEDEEY